MESDARSQRLTFFLRSPLWFVACVALGIVLTYPIVRDLVLMVEVTAAERGYRIALRSGCFNCHGANGAGGVKNEDELREYILDGAPARKRADPQYRQQIASQLLAMPAFRGFVGARDVDDLIVYLRAVSGLITPSEEMAAKGQEVAYRLGCFQCHGPMGAGVSANPGSFKGYIPGWWGNDFRDLAHDDDELRNWILAGEISRLRDNPIAAYFIHRQRLYMPAYRDFIGDADLDALMRYVRWVNSGTWQKQPLDLGK